jgi:GDPmannose 4,6-dehydratase
MTAETEKSRAPGAGARCALLTGLTGQDGSFLAELLLERGYSVTGLVRGGEARSLGQAEHLRGDVQVLDCDLLDREGLVAAVARLRPDELYHLGSPSFVPDSWKRPYESVTAIVGSTAALLEAVRDRSPRTRVFVAGSGAMFGAAPVSPQDELTPCAPESPYAIAKLAAHRLVGAMRSHSSLWACSGILFNHESERRPAEFVTRTVARAAAGVKLGIAREVRLGSLDAVRDWSFAGDTVRGAWSMLQQERPEDYVLASGVGRTVRELARTAFAHAGLRAEDWIRVDPELARAPEPTPSVGDPSKARERLGWEPTVSFEQLVGRMVDAELAALAGAGPGGGRGAAGAVPLA